MPPLVDVMDEPPGVLLDVNPRDPGPDLLALAQEVEVPADAER